MEETMICSSAGRKLSDLDLLRLCLQNGHNGHLKALWRKTVTTEILLSLSAWSSLPSLHFFPASVLALVYDVLSYGAFPQNLYQFAFPSEVLPYFFLTEWEVHLLNLQDKK